jgi:O-antigen ligase
MKNLSVDNSRNVGWWSPIITRSPKRIFLQIALACGMGAIIGLLLLVSPLLALAFVLMIVVLVATFIKPVFLCYLTVIAVALTSGMERGKPIPYLRMNEAVLLLSAAIAFVIITTRENRYPIKFHGLEIAILVLILGTTIIPGAYYLVRGSNLTIDDAIVLLAPLQYLVLFWQFAYLPSSNLERLGIVKYMLFCGVIVAIVGLLQAAKVSLVTELLNNWYASPHEQAVANNANRITSLLGAWNTLGIFMMVNLIIIWAFGVNRPNDLGWPFILAGGGLCVACLILSGSFAGLLGLFGGIILITVLLKAFLSKRNILLFLIAIVVIIITVVLFREKVLGRWNDQFGSGSLVPQTLAYRIELWQAFYLPAIQKNIFWGINPTVPSYYHWPYTESQFLSLLFSFGLIGFVSFLIWILVTLKSLLNRFYQHGDFLRTITATAIAILFVLFSAGFTNAVFGYSGVVDYLWIILALITTDEGLKGKLSLMVEI